MVDQITRRSATAADTEWARCVHHAAYHDVIIRQFGQFDQAVQDDFFAESWNVQTYQVLQFGDAAVGYCFVEHFLDDVYLHELVLAPNFQGKGIGKAVLSMIIREAGTRGLPVRLQVLKKNHAKHLYRKLGFRDVGVTDTHIQMEHCC